MNIYLPVHKRMDAERRGVLDNVLLKITGGLGDQICAIPSVMYALKAFPGVKFSVKSYSPTMFSHLDIPIFDWKDTVNEDHYLVLETPVPPHEIVWQFFTHMTTRCVDYATLMLFGHQMPPEMQQIVLPDFPLNNKEAIKVLKNPEQYVVIHAGRHYKSKTFPVAWWNGIIRAFKKHGFKVVLIGKDNGPSQGYVKTTVAPHVDLRDKLTLEELVMFLKGSRYLFSNDSSPIHIAAAGDAFIGFVASLKRRDLISHWRNGEQAYKTKDFARTWAGEQLNLNFNQNVTVELSDIPETLLKEMLPHPEEVAKYYSDLREKAARRSRKAS